MRKPTRCRAFVALLAALAFTPSAGADVSGCEIIDPTNRVVIRVVTKYKRHIMRERRVAVVTVNQFPYRYRGECDQGVINE